MINIKEKLFSWVENKIGDKVDERIEESLNTRKRLDVESFASELVNEVFNDNEIKKLREKITAEKEFESDFSNEDDEEDDFIDLDLLDISKLNLESTLNTNSATATSCRQILEAFEFQSLDEIISQPSWTNYRKTLQDMLISIDNNKNLANFSLKIFKRFLACEHFPRSVCEGFVTLSESTLNQIEAINKRANTVESEDLYDIKDNKVYHRSSQQNRIEPATSSLDTLMRSMFLLLSAHDNMPASWLRFNEKRLHEIIFSFVNLLASSLFLERRNISGLDIVVILQPRATWCRNWTHSSLGRSLLCQALRKHRRLFQYIVDTVIIYIIDLQEVRNKRNSAKNKKNLIKKNSAISTLGVAESALNTARFGHCFSILTYLVQYKAGRALFPLQTSIRKRPWSIQDIVGLMIDYIEVAHGKLNTMYTPIFMHHLTNMARILLAVEEEISSARGIPPIRRYR